MKKRIIVTVIAVAAGLVAAVVGVHVERIDYAGRLQGQTWLPQ